MSLPRELDLRAAARAEMPDLGLVAPELRAPAVATWRARMANEFSSSTVFEALGRKLGSCFGGELAAECALFAAEERRHGVLCGAVVEACGGEARVLLPVQPPFPEHADAPPRAAALRNLIHVACMSETVAVSLIGAERLEMAAGPLRSLLTCIYADEVGHARFGWSLLEEVAGGLDDEERRAVERYLPVAFAHLEAHELAHLPERTPPPGGSALGLCNGRDGRELFYETIEQIVRPGLRRWFECWR